VLHLSSITYHHATGVAAVSCVVLLSQKFHSALQLALPVLLLHEQYHRTRSCSHNLRTCGLTSTTTITTTDTAQMSATFYEQLAHLEQYEKWPQDILYNEQSMPQSRSKVGKRKRSSSSKKVPTATATKRGRYYSSHVSMHTIQVVW
jgi:hypothetical protein